jgi:hypothetical protein
MDINPREPAPRSKTEGVGNRACVAMLQPAMLAASCGPDDEQRGNLATLHGASRRIQSMSRIAGNEGAGAGGWVWRNASLRCVLSRKSRKEPSDVTIGRSVVSDRNFARSVGVGHLMRIAAVYGSRSTVTARGLRTHTKHGCTWRRINVSRAANLRRQALGATRRAWIPFVTTGS